MGNIVAKKLTVCFSGNAGGLTGNRRFDSAAVTSEPISDNLGHSFCYVSNESTLFSISGASVSANTSTVLSTDYLSNNILSSSTFDSSNCFNSYPLHPIPKFLSGPIDRGFLSGPLDPRSNIHSGPLDQKLLKTDSLNTKLRRSVSHGGKLLRNFSKNLKRSISIPVKIEKGLKNGDFCDNLQWAQGKAGEDRMHVAISEENGWIFVGIYDGFNGPDATDYLLNNLYNEVEYELVFGEKEGILKGMEKALRKCEDGFFEMADEVGMENPELALMGSCVLVMLMKGEDVFLMNVGDSRAVLGQKNETNLERISEESNLFGCCLDALQLTSDHSTCIDEEVRRIKKEHPDDPCAVLNDRVKGSLKVTRAFGAGFLKQRKWNDALLEMFRIDYIGTSPYITCIPFLCHHKLGEKDKFLILSSDGLYQYFTNEEVVFQVELFIMTTPEGDPAQHLVEEVIFRAARKAGLDFHELLEIPQGDRRRYHDDVSVIVISFEGRIWKSCA